MVDLAYTVPIMTNWVTLSSFAVKHEYTVKALYHKRRRKRWPEQIWVKAPDGSILIDEDGWNEWVVSGYEPAPSVIGNPASKSGVLPFGHKDGRAATSRSPPRIVKLM